MAISKRDSYLSQFLRSMMMGAVVAGLSLPATMTFGQDVGNAITDAISDRLSPDNSEMQRTSGQSATERGVNRAIQGALQGQTPSDAVRSGLGEAAQSASETPQQTFQRDQAQQFRNQQSLQNVAPGQTWQQDSQGRFFYQDAYGRTVYRNSIQQGQTQQRRWFAESQNGQPGHFGAQVQSRQNGIAITSVRNDGFAYNAGLREGDILLNVNGQPIQSQAALSQQLNQTQPHQSMQMTVLRNGKHETITVTNPNQPTADRHSVAKPEMQDDSLAKQVEELRQQVKKLRTEVDSLKSRLGEKPQE